MEPTRRPLDTRCLAVALTLALLPACGGSGDASNPAPNPSASASNTPIASLCSAALAASADAAVSVRSAAPGKAHGGLGPDTRDPRDFVFGHRAGVQAARAQSTDVQTTAAASDVGDIAVLQDDGSLIVSPNPFDLSGQGVRFQPNGRGGYDAMRTDATFRSTLGTRLRLGDDDTFAVTTAFSFPFYGQGQTAAFVNSDGNVTFGRSDTAQDERGLGRLLAGPPRIAPFFADLDPSSVGGIFVDNAGDALTVTWCGVPGFDSASTVTTQTSLFPDGSVEVKFASVSLGDGIVALSPGATSGFASVDLKAAGPTNGGTAAVGERFAAAADIDVVAASRLFYQGHADSYDQLVFWTDTGVVTRDTFAYESTFSNAIQGLGADTFDLSSELGSGGQVSSVLVMDRLTKYPADPTARVPGVGENTTLALLGHETGHRWLATLRFRDAMGASSDLLLGRDLVHWSFFFDSDASFMEGNDIADEGGGSFRTVGADLRYSALDLYAMGLVDASEVPPFFFVENPRASQTRESAPQSGVGFQGTRHDLMIADVVAAVGPRDPPASRSPRLFRQAFVYIVSPGRTADQASLDKLERIRAAWEPFFASATGGRMSLDTHLH
jgi:hypothetical protein